MHSHAQPEKSMSNPRKPRTQPEPGILSAPALTGDLPRQQLAAGAQGACAVLRGFEAIREIQMKAAHQALTKHEAFAGKLLTPREPADLMALQAEMVRQDLRDATVYWQELSAAALDMQRQVFGSLVGAAQSEGQALAQTLPAFAAYFQKDSGARQANAHQHT